MPSSMTDLLGNRRRLDIPKADGSPGIYVVYRPQTMTPRKLHELLALEQAAREAEALLPETPDDTEEAEETEGVAAVSPSATPELTPEQREKRNQAIIAAADELLTEFANILIDWDLTDDDGNLIPPTLEGLQDVDYEVISYIFGKVREDARVGKPNGTPKLPPSASGSKPKAQRATSRRRSRNGSH